jgi:hypothetical protein
MEINQTSKANLWDGGEYAFRKSPEYLQKMLDIEKEIDQKYSNLLDKERNLFRRFYLKIQKEIEVIKQKREVRGFGNLYLSEKLK